MVVCLKRGANDLHMVQLMPLPPVISYLVKIQNGLTFLVPSYPGCPVEKRPLNGCLSVCVRVFSGSNSGRAGQLEAQLRDPEFEHHGQSELVAGRAAVRRDRIPRRLGSHVPPARSTHGQDHRAHQGPPEGPYKRAPICAGIFLHPLKGVNTPYFYVHTHQFDLVTPVGSSLGQIHKIWKFCMKFGHLVLTKII